VSGDEELDRRRALAVHEIVDAARVGLAQRARLLAEIGDILARVFVVRQLSVLLGVGAVACAYLVAREVFPERRLMWFTVPVLVSFQPMFTFVNAVVNTDALLIFVFCALIYTTVRVLKTRLTLGLALSTGALLGAGLLTKPFILAMIVPLAYVIGRDLWRGRGRRVGVPVAGSGE